MALCKEWVDAEKKRDPEFSGSTWEAMGYDDVLCPTCGAHLRSGICLNACHLTADIQRRLTQLMREVLDGRKTDPFQSV